MPTRDSYAPGTPCWADLTSTNPEAVRPFYSALLGWEWGDPELPGGGRYWTATLNGAAVAGMPDGAATDRASMWLTYVSVVDVDATTSAALAAGATVVAEPMDVGPAGRRSFITDPVGSLLGLWQAGEHVGARVTSEPGAMIWNEVYAVDTDQVTSFYAALFGWDIGSMTMPDGTDYTTFTNDGDLIGGTAPPAQPDMEPHWHLWFAGADIPGDAARVPELGGTVTIEPTGFEGGHYASFLDPAGARFSLITPPAG